MKPELTIGAQQTLINKLTYFKSDCFNNQDYRQVSAIDYIINKLKIIDISDDIKLTEFIIESKKQLISKFLSGDIIQLLYKVKNNVRKEKLSKIEKLNDF